MTVEETLIRLYLAASPLQAGVMRHQIPYVQPSRPDKESNNDYHSHCTLTSQISAHTAIARFDIPLTSNDTHVCRGNVSTGQQRKLTF